MGPRQAKASEALSRPDPSTQGRILKEYSKLPLAFEKNQGQADARVKFLSRGAGYTLFLTADQAVLSLSASNAKGRGSEANPENERPNAVGSQPTSNQPEHHGKNPILRMKLVGATPHATVKGVDELRGKSNYFVGNDPTKWRSNVPTYAKVKYEGVYPGIDLLYYGNHRQLEFDFIVVPGADPRHVQFDLHGSRRLRLDDDGDLVLKTETGKDGIRWHKPVAYQEQRGMKQVVAVDYAIISGNQVGFKIGKYDVSRPLYIDPLIYSTYLGGNGSDTASGIAVDSSGDAYITGVTSSTNFPTMNPFQPNLGGATNAFVTKLNATGSSLVYSTYLGGSGPDQGDGIAVDSSGDAYVTGSTESSNFPVVNAFQSTFGGGLSNAFVTKFNASGSVLVYSTYLGGTAQDHGVGIAVDSSGNAYVTGSTQSSDFPVVNAFQSANGEGAGHSSVFVTKFNPSGSALVYSTYLGGSGCNINGSSGTGNDDGFGIAVDSSGDAYITGSTSSSNFPTMNALQPTFGGTCGGTIDGFVTKFNASGSALVYSTYLGGAGVNSGNGIAVDSSGDAYVTGQTNSTNFPTMNPLQPTLGGAYNAFVTELNAPGSALVFSTYLGGSANDSGNGIAVDSAFNAYVTGRTLSTNFPTMNPFQATLGGSRNAFVTKFAAAGDFSLSSAAGSTCPTGGNCTTSATVTAGQTATYDLQISPISGFNGTVTLSCSDTLAESTCSVSPSSVSVNGAASAFAATVTTSAASVLGPQTNAPSVGPPSQIVLLSLIILILALLLVGSSTESKRWKGRFVPSLALLLLGFVLLAGCGGGASGGGNNGGGGGNNGTPSGTVTVTGTSNGVSHSASLNLTVS